VADQVAPWLASDEVAAQLKLSGWTAGDSLPANVERHRLATAAYVERARRDLVVPAVYDVDGVTVLTPATFTPPADVVDGALLMVGRLVAREGSPQGLASFGEFGPAAVIRSDPDVERLLGVGRYGRPVAL